MTSNTSIPEQLKINVANIDADPEQPRKHFDESDLLSLGKNMLDFGQFVPIVVFRAGTSTRYVCVDGERRVRAAKQAGIMELLAVILDERPSKAELLVIQASIAIHRADLRPSERCAMLARIQSERGCTVNEVCELLNISQPVGSKLLRINKAHPDVLAKLDAGELDLERAYIVSTEPVAEKQQALLNGAAELSREQLRKRIKSPTKETEAKATTATFPMPGGFVFRVAGPEMTLATAIEVLVEGIRILKKGLAQNYDIKAQARAMAETSRAVRAPRTV